MPGRTSTGDPKDPLRRGFLFYRFPRHVRRIEIDVAVEVL